MEDTIREVTPSELCDVVDPGEVTLVLGAPSVGKSHHLRRVGPSVERLAATRDVDDDELVIVDDFVTAAFDLSDEDCSTDGEPSGMNALFARPGGAVLVTRPRSLDWLCQSSLSVSSDIVERVDSVLVVRTPPAESSDAIDEIREHTSRRSLPGLSNEERSSIVERVTNPSYDFEDERLGEQIGTVEETVTPAAFLSLSQYGSETVLVEPDVRTVVGDCDITVEPLGEATLELISSLHPRAEEVGCDPAALSPAVATAIALVASSLADDDTEWFEPLVRHRPLAGAAEALEIAFDLPPGTIDHLRVFASESMRTRIGQRLAAQPETETAIAEVGAAFEEIRAGMRAVRPSLDEIAVGPDEYGSAPLVGAWHWEEPETLHAAAAEREFPNSDDGLETDDGPAGVDVDKVVDALDGGVVVLSGPKASGKRRLAANVATELTTWGTTVRLTDLSRPDHIRVGIDATPDAVVVATYGAEPARITSEAGIRSLVEWVADDTCSGALLICDDEFREQFDAVADRTGCADVAAWRDRIEFELDDIEVAPERTSRAVADDLLSAMDWPETRRPSRLTLDVERITDQSTLAAIAGMPDKDLDAAFVGQVLADAVTVVARTARPSAAKQWLALFDDLVGDVGLNRSDTDGAIRYRGAVSGTAMAAVASENPTTDEWVEAIADCAVALTNETATPPGRDSVGGDHEPFVGAFANALSRLAWPTDGTGPNHGALACVDQVLHRTVDAGEISEEPGLTLLCRVYGSMTERIIETVDDTTAADDALAPVAALVQQAAATNEEGFAAFVIGNSFASTIGAVAGAACPLGDLSTWVDALGSQVRESVAFMQRQDNRAELLRHAYTGALGFWVFEHECPDDRIEPWLVAVGEDLCRTATTADLDDPVAFVAEIYGQAVRHVVTARNFDRAERLFGACDRLVDTVAASDLAAEEWTVRAALHAAALAAFASVEQSVDGVNDGPYGIGALPFSDSPRFEDWIELYDGSVARGAAAETAHRERFLTAAYRGALSTRVHGFDDDSSSKSSRRRVRDSASGISPRRERVWFEALTDRIETVAAADDLVTDPVAFLDGVFGDAAVNWAADGETSLSGEWITSLARSFRECRWEIDGPTKMEWFDAFAEVDAAVLQTVMTRTDIGNRSHDRLVQAVLSQVETGATAADNPPHPVNYVSSVFGTALALAVEAEPAEVRFGVTEVLTAAEERADFEWVGIERAGIFERIYARALAVVGRTNSDHANVEAWLDVVTERIEATATRAVPENPAEFVASVYTRAYVDTVEGDATAWRQRLDDELRAFAASASVDDPAAFLEEVYADIVVKGVKGGEPFEQIEAYVAAVRASIETAADAGIVRTDDTLERTFTRSADELSTANPRASADYAARLDHGLREVVGDDLAAAAFESDGTAD
ncbi:hypothetical protein E6P09_15215 (plasmid) [Haloferax mediterranei ATCC 33500]|uniref:Uncharacterized protein n=1 Tax=Haloferax mediterranei (strain ATCC 33500 / DSM 1411 / JCM 8866 / NBRC 14739 / NCIMB 2177 / R-4) TaxID=523841 RepID=I3RAD1_HALMT|nr:hypothetical protein [Haloferax mediterranei]AFK21191.1 hypothetical protein HFX_6064 [Haloferax mediterranei ATCC 33500]AHZ24695.1 hypothetical protein BM92_17595 [Haloferax mediterranei ATCC 33500]ELZ97473.1 hypothetical protein C439_19163 [Haloferax mediterranei ATCC 33500]MDX5990236.1 hypothetical protein [Haloferax mediterranei ATCC 33500]QCQ76694.1 hypothetical protein E6P09_15215 [Haloferax mediterranei ATCC 33500]